MILTQFVFLLLLTSLTTNALDKDNEETNDISASPASAAKLDSTLRKALLRALAELENDSANDRGEEEDDNSVRRAQASSFTIYAKTTSENSKKTDANEESNNMESDDTTENISQESLTEIGVEEDTATTTSSETQDIELESTTKDPNKPAFVLFQRSNSISEPISIKSIEKDSKTDPLKDAELIFTSASNNFNRDINGKNENYKIASNKDGVEAKNGRSLKVANQNAIVDEDAKQKSQKNQESSTESTTTLAPSTTTLETEAKVEQVQFFSAPLVAAFTVHQDEQGQPKKVEAIYKNEASKQKQEILNNQQQRSNQPTLQNSQITSTQTDLRQKQQILEEQLLRLKQQQTQQEQYFQQQLLEQEQPKQQQLKSDNSQQLLNLKQQQELFFQQPHQQSRNNNQQNFAKLVNKAKNPTGQLDLVFNEPDKNILDHAFSTNLNHKSVPVLNRFTSTDARININNQQAIGNNVVKQSQAASISVQPSITFDPELAENGKLPLNAQILPVKEAINFRTPFVNSLNFQPLPTVQKNSVFQTNLIRNPQFNFQTPNQQNLGLNQQLPNFQTNQNQANNHNFVQSQLNTAFNQATPTFPLSQPNQVNKHNFVQPQVNTAFNQANPTFAPGFNNNGFSQNPIPFQTTPFNNNLLNNNNFNPSQFNIGQLPLQNTPTRFNRQELGTGNFLNNNKNNAFTIQQSSQPFLPTHELSFARSNNNPLLEGNRFFRSNQESTFQAPQNTRFVNPPQNNAQNNRFFRSNLEGSNQNNNAQNNRFFRSNQESTFTNNINQRFAPPQVNRQLNSLLFNQGFGGRNTEDLNVVTKVLSFNYNNQNNRVLRNVPPF